MSKSEEDLKSIIIYGVILIVTVIGYAVYMKSMNYHLQWSSPNGKYIWVDKDGKP